MASINVLLLTRDSEYSEKLGQYMSRRHTDIRLSIVDSPENSAQVMAINTFSVILVETEFSEVDLPISGRSVCAYLSASDTQDTLNDRKVFCKYQSGETIYKIILDLFSEVSSISAAANASGFVTAFVGANGGAGTTTIAVSYAKKTAASGARTLYLNLDNFFDSDSLLSGESIGTMSDLLFAVISAERTRGSVNLSAKAQALLSRDISGVYFIKSCGNPFEFNDIDEDRLNSVYTSLTGGSAFDAVILDVPAHFDIAWKLMLNKSDKIFVVTENSPRAAANLTRFVNMLKAYDSHTPGTIEKAAIIMNMNRDRTADWSREVCAGIPFCGGVPKYNDDDVQGIMNAVMRLEMWNRQ